MEMSNIAIAAAGGLVPSLIWLYFLLKEDSRCPEPRHMVALAFFVGMLAVPLVLPPEEFAFAHLAHGIASTTALAAIEEVTKYLLAAIVILWQPAVDEPIDYVIYLITVALGFAAVENALFILHPLSGGHMFTSAITDNVRFFGSTLLHIVASSFIGFSLAFSYKKSFLVRIAFVTVGIILAIALHTTFNLLIMSSSGSSIAEALLLVWTGVVIVFALFEVLKYRTYRKLPANVC